jgi:hypothetical protein
MATEDDKSARLLAKLIVDTQNKSLVWKALDSPSQKTPTKDINPVEAVLARFRTADKTYIAVLGDRAFRVDKFPTGATLQYRLSIADVDGLVLKMLPNAAGLESLMNAIEDRISRVDDFLDNYLADTRKQ